MKIWLILFSSVIYIQLVAQDYQTIRSSDSYFYKAHDNSYFLASRIDSIEINGGDSIFYSFKTIRPNDTISNSNCELILDDSWLGKKIIIEQGGRNVFINKYEDSIFIETRATVGDTFQIYTFDNLNFIKGTVIDHDTSSFLNYSDSVKTIKLFSNEPSFVFNDSLIMIAKNYGLIKLYPMYSFPEKYPVSHVEAYYEDSDSINSMFNFIGNVNDSVGFYYPTYFDFYDMEIGDFVQTHYYNRTDGDLYPETTNLYEDRTINNKWVISSDSIVYEFITKHYKSVSGSNFYINNWIDTTIVGYGNLQSPIVPFLPEEWRGNDPSYSPNQSSSIKNHTLNCNTVLNDFQYPQTNYSNNCFSSSLDEQMYNYNFVLGVGIKEYNHFEIIGSYLTDTWLKVLYTNTSLNECGEYYPAKIYEHENLQTIIFPNPTKKLINYRINKNHNTVVNILSLGGKVVHTNKSLSQIGQINIEHLTSGLYLIEFKTETGQTSIHKLIIE